MTLSSFLEIQISPRPLMFTPSIQQALLVFARRALVDLFLHTRPAHQLGQLAVDFGARDPEVEEPRYLTGSTRLNVLALNMSFNLRHKLSVALGTGIYSF